MDNSKSQEQQDVKLGIEIIKELKSSDKDKKIKSQNILNFKKIKILKNTL